MSESANGQANMPGHDGVDGPPGAAPGAAAGAPSAGGFVTGGTSAGSASSGGALTDGAPVSGVTAGGVTASGVTADGVTAGTGNGSGPGGTGSSGTGSGRAAPDGEARGIPAGLRGTNYKWLALSNTTLGMLAATVNASIVIIALPAIFRGIHLDPLAPGNVSYRSTRSTAPMGRCG